MPGEEAKEADRTPMLCFVQYVAFLYLRVSFVPLSKQPDHLLASLSACLLEGPKETQLQSVVELQGQFFVWPHPCFRVTTGSAAFADIPIRRESGFTRFISLYCR
jgi:hypothetical protein